jgi:hypothetical protein
MPSQELWGSTFIKPKKTNFLPLLSKGKHRCIPPPLGILLYNRHYVIIACAFMLQELNETLECIVPLVVLCLADRTSVEVEWQFPLTRFRAFYTLVRGWNVENFIS